MDPMDALFNLLFAAVAEPRYAPGDSIAEFRIVRFLGRGGQGEVYQAWDGEGLNRIVAIKVLHGRASLTVGDATVAWEPCDLQQEARHSARLELQHAIRIYEYRAPNVGTCTPALLLMEYANGGKLTNWSFLLQNELGPRQSARWAGTLLESLHVMHEQEKGLFHGDVKPDNILLCRDSVHGEQAPAIPDPNPDPARYHAKLADLGLARSASADRRCHGTPGFAAPEQLQNGEVNAATDIFGIGATLYFLLAGEAPGPHCFGEPFTAPDGAALKKRRIDRGLQRIILKSLAVNPNDRYPTASAFAADLDAWANQRPTSFTGFSGRIRLSFRTLPPLGHGLVVIVFVAVVVIFVVLYRNGSLARAESDAVLAAVKIQQDKVRDQDVTSARRLARNGDWEAAMPEYDRLIGEVEPRLAATLRLERLHGYLSLHRIPAFKAELESLAGFDPAVLGPGEAVLRLYEAERLSWGHPDKFGGEFRTKLDEARKAFDRNNSAPENERPQTWIADSAYLTALRAPSDGEYVNELKTVLTHDANHYPALRSLAVITAARRPGPQGMSYGRDLPDHKVYCSKLKESHTSSPLPEFVDCIVHTVNNAAAPDSSKCASTAGFDAGQAGRLNDILSLVASARQRVRTFQPLNPRNFRLETADIGLLHIPLVDQVLKEAFIDHANRTLTKVASHGIDIARHAGRLLPEFGIPFRTLRPVAHTFQSFDFFSRAILASNVAVGGFSENELDRILGQMTAAHAVCDDGTLLIGQAFVRFIAFGQYCKSEDPEAIAKVETILKLMSRYDMLPMLVSDSPLVYHTLYAAVLSATGLARLHPGAEVLLPGLEEMMPLLLQRGRADPKFRGDFARQLVELMRPYIRADDVQMENQLWKSDTLMGRWKANERMRYVSNLVVYPFLSDWIFQCERMGADATVPRKMQREVDGWFNTAYRNDIDNPPTK